SYLGSGDHSHIRRTAVSIDIRFRAPKGGPHQRQQKKYVIQTPEPVDDQARQLVSLIHEHDTRRRVGQARECQYDDGQLRYDQMEKTSFLTLFGRHWKFYFFVTCYGQERPQVDGEK